MITRKEKRKIFEDTISHLRKKFISSDSKSDAKEDKAEKFRRLPLD